MNELWRQIAERLIGDGHSPRTPAQVYQFVRLHKLAEDVVQSGRSPEYLAALHPELDLGDGITLRRLSIGAEEWLDCQFSGWVQDHPSFGALAVAYAMAHSAQPEVLWRLRDPESARKAIRTFSRSLRMSRSELEDALETFIFLSDGAREKAKSEADRARDQKDHGWLIEQLCSDYGYSPDYVLWVLPREEVKMMLDQGNSRRAREASAKAGKPVRITSGGRQDEALRSFYSLRDEIDAEIASEQAEEDVA